MSNRLSVTVRGGVVFAFAIVAVVIAGCGGGSSSSSAPTGGSSSPDSTEAAKPGGVLKFALEGEPTTLNPSQVIENPSAIVGFQIGETLFEVNDKGEAEPNLATGSEVSKDGLTWTIPLRKGVKFSTGEPMTADDVVFSIEQARTGPYFASLYEQIETVKAVSPSTVEIKTSVPSPALLPVLGLYAADIVPANYGGVSEKEFALNPIGTGPFALKSWKHGQGIDLVKNTHYWKPNLPLLDEVQFTFTADENARLAQLRGGDIDATRATPLTVKSGLSQAPSVQVDETGYTNVDYFLIAPNLPLFKDPSIREAVNLAVDRDGIIKAATADKGEPGASYLPPAVTYHDPNLQPPERDVEKAKELVAAAVKKGVDPSFTLNSYSFDSPSGISTQIIQQNLEEVGFNVTLERLDEAALTSKFESSDFEAVVGPYYPVLTDPTELTAFYLTFYAEHSGADYKPQEKLANEASVEMDPTKRGQLYTELQEMIADEESLQILDYQPGIMARQENVVGFEYDPVGFVHLDRAGFTE